MDGGGHGAGGGLLARSSLQESGFAPLGGGSVVCCCGWWTSAAVVRGRCHERRWRPPWCGAEAAAASSLPLEPLRAAAPIPPSSATSDLHCVGSCARGPSWPQHCWPQGPLRPWAPLWKTVVAARVLPSFGGTSSSLFGAYLSVSYRQRLPVWLMNVVQRKYHARRGEVPYLRTIWPRLVAAGDTASMAVDAARVLGGSEGELWVERLACCAVIGSVAICVVSPLGVSSGCPSPAS
nr:unnamed protein product [Digitaria exilis]